MSTSMTEYERFIEAARYKIGRTDEHDRPEIKLKTVETLKKNFPGKTRMQIVEDLNSNG